MGLDVYLYRYEDYADTIRREERYERESEANWAATGKKWEQLTEAERDAVSAKNKAVAAALELGEWGQDKARAQKIEIPSEKYPKHLFKVGYFHSSYNDSGTNAVWRARAGFDLGDIFDDPKEYHVQPDWTRARERAIHFLGVYREAVKKAGGRFGVMRLMDVGTGGYSNADGFFAPLKGMNVRAIIHGSGPKLFGSGCDVFVVYEHEPEPDGGDWYEQAIEIVIETCDYVLRQPDQHKFYMHWSG